MSPFRYFSIVFVLAIVSIAACAGGASPGSTQTNEPALRLITPKDPFRIADAPPPPDYSNTDHWAALPARLDPADVTPADITPTPPVMRKADVFFIHPTTYFGRTWNQPLDHKRTNDRTDAGSIRNQASVFNGCCRVYAPRYRQATLAAFLKSDTSAQQATEFAYGDVREAFRYYLEHYNNGRPFIIASHSQGSYHALRLLEDEVDGTDRMEQFVAAYVIGNGIAEDWFARQVTDIDQCQTSTDTGCVASWSTWLEGSAAARTRNDIVRHYDTGWESNAGKVITCTNPLSWRSDSTPAPASANIGAWTHGRDRGGPDATDPAITGAYCENGALYITRPDIEKFNRRIHEDGNYHSMDYQLFYSNVRGNAAARVEAFIHP